MGNATLVITSENFEQEVAQASEPVLVDFTATWCGPCRQLAPVIDSLAEKYAGKVKVGKVDVDEQNTLAERFGIQSVPSVFIFKGGEVIESVRGYQPEGTFVRLLDALVSP